MKKIIYKGLATVCLIFGLGSIASAQLPSQRAVPLVVKPDAKPVPAQSPVAAGATLLPSEGGNIPKGANWTNGALPSSSGLPLLSVAEKRKRLPSNAANPPTTIKRKSGG